MQNPLFCALPQGARRSFVNRYQDFLRERDGSPNFVARTLSQREKFLADLAADPVCRSGPAVVEQRVYDHNAVERAVAVEGLDDWALWTICLSKCSRMEEYAVRYLDEKGRAQQASPDDPCSLPYRLIDLEERYHARLLESLLQVVGIRAGWRPPSLVTRLTLRAILLAPRFLANITVLCGEIIGLATFKLFLEKGRALCADQPRARGRIELLLKEILTDEIGHVLFLRSQLGPFRLVLARLLLPIVARVLIADYPEMKRLFGSRLLDEMLGPQLLQRALDAVGGLPQLTSQASQSCQSSDAAGGATA